MESADLFSLKGRRVLITGAAGGIGGATARLASQTGASLVLSDVVSRSALEKNVGDLACEYQVEIFDSGDIRAVEQAARSIGPIDALIETSGVYPHVDWMDQDFERAFDEVIQVNVRGPLNIARAFFPEMARRRRGSMVFCGSVAGWMGGIKSGPHYAFSKGGLHAFVRWLARLGAPNQVLVNGVAPSTTRTALVSGVGYDESQYPLGRMAEPHEIASALVFLCMPGASYISGAILDVNGGIYHR